MEATNLTWLDYATAIGSILTPFLVAVVGVIGWGIRIRLQRRVDLEERLREDRIAIYNAILEPFIILLMSDEAWNSDSKNKGKDKDNIAKKKLLSLDYRQTGFRLSLMGSDEVVKSYNELMQYFYNSGPEPSGSEIDTQKIMSLLGYFLLSIRRSMGNETTNLDQFDMLEWFISDARKYRPSS